MATAQQVIDGAFDKLSLRDIETSVSGTELTNAITILNDVMEQLELDGYGLGWTTITAGSDTVTVDNGEINFVKTQLAGRLAQLNEMPISQALAEDFIAAKKSVIRGLNEFDISLETASTAGYFIKCAFNILNAKSLETPISAKQLNSAVSYLNDLMAEYEAKGLLYGYNEVSGLADDTGLPSTSYPLVKSALALKLSSMIGIPVNNEVVKLFKDAEKAVYMRSKMTLGGQVPEGMPMGGDVYQSYDSLILTGGGKTMSNDNGEAIEK